MQSRKSINWNANELTQTSTSSTWTMKQNELVNWNCTDQYINTEIVIQCWLDTVLPLIEMNACFCIIINEFEHSRAHDQSRQFSQTRISTKILEKSAFIRFGLENTLFIIWKIGEDRRYIDDCCQLTVMRLWNAPTTRRYTAHKRSYVWLGDRDVNSERWIWPDVSVVTKEKSGQNEIEEQENEEKKKKKKSD